MADSASGGGNGVSGTFNASKDGPGDDNDGNALITGALYFNTTDGEMRVYDGTNWIAASAAQNATVLDYTYTLSGSDATISGSDDNSATLAFSAQESVDVFLNGVKLVPKIGGTANDYHLDTANTVTLTSTAVSGDVILVRVYKTFTVGDAVPASTGGTFSGNVTHGGTLTANGTINANSTIDMQGTELILDADADTSFHASTDDQIDIKIGGTDVGNFNSNTLKLVKDGNPILEIEDTAETAYGGSWLSAPTVDFKHSTANADEHGVLGILKFKGTTKNNLGVLTNNTDIARLDGISIEGSSGDGQRITDVKGGFRFKGMDGAGNFVDLMTLQGKDLTVQGNVLKPNQPAFRVGLDSDSTFGASAICKFNTTSLEGGCNIGNHYDTSTGRFQAPVAGYYYFSAVLIYMSITDGQDMNDSFRFRKNGTSAQYSWRRAQYEQNTTGSSTYFTDFGATGMQLSANDYVDVYLKYNEAVHGNSEYSCFQGYLVG
tara:strand:+ start:1 stop:1473 length:1473 start_codon:yes stop_codon:yes gene_type:complete